jgi:[glutamine synthetase] adenylyltransferase / [glutamine synthetase]-adenylyl-L-tyrosine phosphorylase
MQAAERIEMLLAGSPDRRTAARYLGRLRAESPVEFDRISHSQAALRAAVAVFSYSNFLSEAVLRDPGRLIEVAASNRLYRVLSAEELAHALAARPMSFAAFRRRELLRIALRDILAVAELAEITQELSNLADAILDAAYRQVRGRLADCHGEPRLADGSPAGFSVLSLGKLGGSELNYSSDVDLMFVYAGNGHTDGAAPLTNKEFFKKLANEYTALLSAYTPEGQCYRVDLRLRPDGGGGEICLPEDATRAYYAQRARDWEKQMLIKARVSAGERAPGERLLEFVEPLIYQSSLDFRAVEAVSETRQRISEKMAARRKSRGVDVKLTPGGIRDIEFLVQCLQRLHGGRVRWVRHGGTLLALSRLRDKDLLSDGEYARLANAYQFLRAVEHRLQLDEDRQTHTLPSDPDALEVLARKMPAEATGAGLTAATFTARLGEHLAAVREIYDRVVCPEAPPAAPAAPPRRRELQRFERFQELTGGAPAGIAELFDLSSYFGDELLRDPGLAAEIGQPFTLDAAPPVDLRRFYRAQMLRIQSRSILESAPIFESLNQTSALADYVIRAAYEQAGARGGEMMVIALGRLGMREFDLGSDADLVFVTPDGADLRFWTGVAERMIQTITAYTGGGVMFAIDTRLRPNGREGDLVLSESAYKTYFAEKAEAWEGITYMKSRPVAGNAERATAFLHELQQVDWRRYGQSMRSREELAHMRARLEKEQGPRNPLKAGAGGYYDIDFALMYLRLRGAGIFYKTLNTPERIEVIESIGQMPKSDAEFLRRAATLYRAIDHGQRIATGRAEGSLPSSPSQVETLTRLVHRWIPPDFHARPLPETLAEIRSQTRQYFNRLFGVNAPVPPSTK